jgi:ferredoxin
MAKYKVEIDRDLCIGDQACCAEAPNTFEMDDENIAVVTNPAGDSDDEILAAAKTCPVDAIKVIDTATGKQVWPEA